MKQIRLRALTAIGAVTVACLVSEVGLRIHSKLTDPTRLSELAQLPTAQPPPWDGSCTDPAANAHFAHVVRISQSLGVVYELKPNLDYCFYGARAQTNSQGFRATVDYERPKPPGTRRVLILGDSQTFGQGVTNEETFSARLEARLANQGHSIEVVNTGVDGYNTAQQAAFLAARGMSLEPDCILMLFVRNDLRLPVFMLNPTRTLTLNRSFLVELWKRTWNLHRLQDPFALLVLRSEEQIPDEYRYMVGLEGYRNALASIAQTAGDVPVLNFAQYPDGPDWVKTANYSRSLGIQHPLFRFPWGPDNVLSRKNRHLNPRGHARVARQMLRGLRNSSCWAMLTQEN